MRHCLRTEAGTHLRRTRGRRHGRFLQNAAPVPPARAFFIATCIAACLLAPVHARAGDLSGEMSLASQLVDRGLPITSATPILQGAVAWTTPSGWSLGLSGGIELRSPGHLAAGVARVAHAWTVSTNWRMQADLVYYHYAGRLHANVYEPGVYWLYRDILTFGLSGVYIVGGGEHRLHPAADLNVHWPLAGGFSLSAGIGVTRYDASYGRPPNAGYYAGYYRYGQAGLLWSHGGWRIELDRVAIDPGARRYLRGVDAPSWFATVSRSF